MLYDVNAAGSLAGLSMNKQALLLQCHILLACVDVIMM